ncbi:MAG TPA: hypothetical protein VJT73_03830 [Polyangiaceae bacterium]|nr:hypothetical protein [Polyangiaceae bacterium]
MVFKSATRRIPGIGSRDDGMTRFVKLRGKNLLVKRGPDPRFSGSEHSIQIQPVQLSGERAC